MVKTDFMTTTTTNFKRRCRAFTLVEVMVASTLGTIVLAGVVSTFLMLGRSGANVANYSMMETQSRRALEELSQDLRMAKQIVWNSAESVTLTVPDNYTATGNQVTYAFDNTSGDFYRMPGTTSATNPKTTLVRSATSCTFARFDRKNNATENPLAIKRLQLTLVVRRKSQTVAAASNTIFSASYILRNRLAN
jgi:prepilin-type N-terminal cleavage/methylation domain-containing protein